LSRVAPALGGASLGVGLELLLLGETGLRTVWFLMGMVVRVAATVRDPFGSRCEGSSTTMDTYAHVMPAMQRDAAERMDALFAAPAG
jgi:hypothetical protein